MSWKIRYSDGARHDLRNLYEYIAYDLLVPETAAEQTQRIMKGVRSLGDGGRDIKKQSIWQSL